MLAFFGVAVFAGAALVFLVQPMVAKMVLPVLGGTPSVWNTAMLFFQGVLLAGYAYAHVVTRGNRRRHLIGHMVVLAAPALFLPLSLPLWRPPDEGFHALWLLGLLLVTAGIPYFVVTTASPLLQRWFSLTGHERGADPYFLYAAGNAGSLLALIAYPAVVEPTLTLSQQAWLWTAGYVTFVVFAGGSMYFTWRRWQIRQPDAAAATTTADHAGREQRGTETREAPAGEAAVGGGVPGESTTAVAVDTSRGGAGGTPAPPAALGDMPGRVQRLRWVLLGFIPSSLMLSVTTYLTSDIAAVPLLWIVPLALYLLTFILAFSSWRWMNWRVPARALPLLVLALVVQMTGAVAVPIWAVFVLHLGTLVAAGLTAHGRLAAERPPPHHLTRFFLLVSVGGVLGGVFNALVAPVAFDSLLEYGIGLALALAVRPVAQRDSLLPGRWRPVEDLVLAAAILYLLLGYLNEGPGGGSLLVVVLAAVVLTGWHLSARVLEFAAVMAVVLGVLFVDRGPSLLLERTFFGIVDVYESGDYNVLAHGTTVHGYQSLDPERADRPLSYHHYDGPIGDVFDTFDDTQVTDRTAVLGLGIGALAAYTEAGDQMDFYEIDPLVADVATNPGYFTYLPEAAGDVEVILGDGRLRLADAPDATYGMIVMDAFSSDAIPVHLATREAVAMYLEKTRPSGLIAFNITNRYVDLAPVLTGIADELDLAGLIRTDAEDESVAKAFCTWVVLAREEAQLASLAEDERWSRLDAVDDPIVWTDRFSNLLTVLDFG